MFGEESPHERGGRGWISTARMVARSRGAVVSIHRRLSRKKGRHYGEGHQKALQISVGRLPLAGVLVGGRERLSCQASGPSATLGIWVSMPLLEGAEERFPLPTRRGCRRKCHGLFGDEAPEISSSTLL